MRTSWLSLRVPPGLPVIRLGAAAWDRTGILILSGGLLAFWLATRPISYHCDSFELHMYAKALSGQPHGQWFYTRGPAYPALMVLTGLTGSSTFRWLVAFQAFCALITPLLLYEMLRPFSRPAAIVATVLTCISMVPFYYANAVYADPLFIFGHVLMLFALTRIVVSQSIGWLYGLAVVAVLVTLLKPPGTISGLLVFAVAAVAYLRRSGPTDVSVLLKPSRTMSGMVVVALAVSANWRRWGHAIAAVMLFFVSTMTWSLMRPVPAPLGDPALVWPNGKPATTAVSHSKLGSITNWSGRAFFYQFYIPARQFAGARPSLIHPSNGPMSAEFFRVIKHFVYGQQWSWDRLEPRELYAAYVGRPEEFYRALIDKPNFAYAEFLRAAGDTSLGPVAADRLAMGAALEALQRYPDTVVLFLVNTTSYLMGVQRWSGLGSYTISAPCAPPAHAVSCTQLLTRSQLDETNDVWWELGSSVTFLKGKFDWFYSLLFRLGIFVCAVLTLTWQLAVPGRRALAIAAWSIILSQALITAVFAEPQQRYIDVSVFPLVIVAALGCDGLVRYRLRADFRRASSPELVNAHV